MKSLSKLGCLIWFLGFLMIPRASASGWGDFSVSIGEGYWILRANSYDVCLGHGADHMIYHPIDFEESPRQTGPIERFVVINPKLVFFQTSGSRMRNRFKGDTFVEADLTKQFFFVWDATTMKLTGPLSGKVFEKHPLVMRPIDKINWSKPINPALKYILSAIVVGLLLCSLAIYRFCRKRKWRWNRLKIRRGEP